MPSALSLNTEFNYQPSIRVILIEIGLVNIHFRYLYEDKKMSKHLPLYKLIRTKMLLVCCVAANIAKRYNKKYHYI